MSFFNALLSGSPLSSFMSLFLEAVEDEDGAVTYMPTIAGYTVFVLAMVVFLIIGCAIGSRKKRINTKQLCFSGLALALGCVASFLTLFEMPMGGSVTALSMFFISLIGYWYGPVTGIMAAVSYGLIQLTLNPYIVSVPQLMLDYILGFGALGFSGFFSKFKSKFAVIYGFLTGAFGRLVFTVLSGWIFFGSYASYYGFKYGFTYSLAYNSAYICTEAAITVAILLIPQMRKALAYTKRIAEDQ